jgi:hypothetical protein
VAILLPSSAVVIFHGICTRLTDMSVFGTWFPWLWGAFVIVMCGIAYLRHWLWKNGYG